MVQQHRSGLGLGPAEYAGPLGTATKQGESTVLHTAVGKKAYLLLRFD